MTEPLTDTVALVTGASSGIGAATATALAARGAAVAVLARRRDRLQQLKDSIVAAGATALVVQADVADAAQAREAVEHVVAELGRLDIVINNAGLMRMGAAAEASIDDWDQMVSVNVLGVLYVTRAALPHLIVAAADSPRKVADLVTISSTGGRVARPGTAVYALSKFGVNAFSEAIRQELIDKRVRVGVVEPGRVDTEINLQLPQQFRDALDRQSADIEVLLPEDIADAVTYMVTRNRRVAVNEILVRAAEQTW
ncbi:MAG: hypothetical protein QOE41_2468 [Mycobacterium sp.]|jgi:NADP-dependent 3-hydroxy acid dehydrogenase YdfG|nr:clavaldehyde dehydrogenase [Mycobacterium sp.]MDT5133157.1 hypothetical protein [Mycobacterium sp.]